MEIDGPGEVFQQTPLLVIEAPPSIVTFPPEIAEIVVTDAAAEVVKIGSTGGSALGGHPINTIDKNPNNNNGLYKKLIFALMDPGY